MQQRTYAAAYICNEYVRPRISGREHMLRLIHGSHAECLDARPIKSGVERCVHLAWLPFLLSLRPLIFLSPISSQAFTLHLSNMLVWDQFVTYSLIIVTFFLTAPRPSHALPVNPPDMKICDDGSEKPCICNDRLGLGKLKRVIARQCRTVSKGIHFKFPNLEDSDEIVWVSHLFFYRR
jgi:hypothetical protein